MEGILILLSAYGLTFGLQHKFPILHGKNAYLDKMLACTYCTGFWAGGGAYFLLRTLAKPVKLSLGEALTFAFAGAATSYLLDTAARTMESHCDPIIIEDEDEEK